MKKIGGEPENHALVRSRGGFGTKFHLVCDGNGIPLAAVLTLGQRQECTQFEAVMDAVRLPGRRGRSSCWPVELAGDKGDSSHRIRRWLARHGIKAVIPRRSDQRPAARRAPSRRGYVQSSVGGRALLRLAERVPGNGDADLYAGGELPGDGEIGHDPAVLAETRPVLNPSDKA